MPPQSAASWWARHRSTIVIGFIVSLVVGIILATGPPFWFKYVRSSATHAQSGVQGFTGGCTAFRVYAQNRWQPYGTRLLNAPYPSAKKVGGFAANEVIYVDGWVHTVSALPSNTPPWNSDIWFHVADGSGWVSFPGVRAQVTSQDPTGYSKNGGPPAVTLPECQGAQQ